MEEEIKKAYMDWSEKGVSYLNCMYVYDTMMDVDEALQTCDTILDEIDLGIDYSKVMPSSASISSVLSRE